MKLNSPKKLTFWVSVCLFILGMIVALGAVSFIPAIIGVLAVLVAYLLLVLGNILKGF